MRTKEDDKITKYSSIEGYDFEFLGVGSSQLNFEPTKASFGGYIDLPPDVKFLNLF